MTQCADSAQRPVMAKNRRVALQSNIMSLWVLFALFSLTQGIDLNAINKPFGAGVNELKNHVDKVKEMVRDQREIDNPGGVPPAANNFAKPGLVNQQIPFNQQKQQQGFANQQPQQQAFGNQQPPQQQAFGNQQQQQQQGFGNQQQQGFGNQQQQGFGAGNVHRDGLPVNQHAPPQAIPRKSSPALKLAEHPACQKDVKMFCSGSNNNFAVLDCLQNDLKSDQDITEDCQHVIWGYKKNLTTDLRFDSAAKEVCKSELIKFPECKVTNSEAGYMIPCLIDFKPNVTNTNCKTFLTKMASIVFSDYRLIYKFAESCGNDIVKLSCGRLHKEDDDAPHSQGRTVECLSENVKSLDDQCKHEILRIAELQADDYHLDRPLFYACREDRERLCKRTKAGGGKVYKCLMRHKFERDMSTECREKLTQRQKLMQSDYKVNKGLAQACQQDIMKHKCIHDSDPGFKHARLSRVVLCLEEVMKDGGQVENDCVIELKEVRKSLMEDYKISPEIVSSCAEDINKKCGGGMQREGKTLHCLMDLARPKKNPNMLVFKSNLEPQCQRELENLLKEADVGEDWTVDPALRDACQSVVDVHCKDIKEGEGRVLSCLMEHLDSKTMNDNCEERLMEIQYFLARDFSLDPRLYKYCHKDAVTFCQAEEKWHMEDDTTPERGPLVFACLYRRQKLYPHSPEEQLSRACSFEVRRVMRQRAISVELEPRIEEPCMGDLGAYCSEETEKGDEMECLQRNYNELTKECQFAVGNFTEDEDSDPNMDRLLMKACSPMIKTFCENMLEKDVEPGDVMECLIQHKNDAGMDEKCAAGIEHHQLITLKDYHFSVKFKENCKDDVLKHCRDVRKKSDVVECLSEYVRNAVLKGSQHVISGKCRKQLSFELLQRSENIQLDPQLNEQCSMDLAKFCTNVTPGKANKIECLKKNQKSLSQNCHEYLFKREETEAHDVTADYLLMHACKKMIKRFCMNVEPSGIFTCLKEHKRDEDFDSKCRKVIIERQRQRNKDIRLSPKLDLACKKDVMKFCSQEAQADVNNPVESEGKVIQCLKIKFAQTHKLSDSCKEHLRTLIKESILDYQQDPQLVSACKTQIDTLCEKEKAFDIKEPDGGKVIECLKMKIATANITLMNAPICFKEIARVLAQDQADVHVDPVLYRECALDLKHYCYDVPRGEGRQMSCLLAALDDKKVRLRPTCEKMLRDRVNMWELAAKAAPPETLKDLVQQVTSSESRNYFLGVMFAVIGMIFIGGLFCGRVTKRVRQELKNR